MVNEASLTSLDAEETSVRRCSDLITSGNFLHPDYPMPQCDDCEESFRHSHWQRRRLKVMAALVRCHASPARLHSFSNCGCEAVVQCHSETGEIRVSANHCHDRFCQPCCAARGRELQSSMRKHVQPGVRLRFVTLTLRHSPLHLADVLDRLRNSFAILRTKSIWKDNVTGGCSVLEVKLSKSGMWHPHLHMILEGNFIDQKDLSAAWWKITGDSYIVDIREVESGDDRDMGLYLTKYVTKPAGFDIDENPDKYDEYILAMKGQRLLNKLGSWRKWPDEEDAEDQVEAKGQWRTLCTLTVLVRKAREGDPVANLRLQALQSRGPTEMPLLIPSHAPP